MYLNAVINVTAMVGEQVLFVFSFGQSAPISIEARVANSIPKIPFKFGELAEGIAGETNSFGNITIRKGLSWGKFVETLRHEAVHRFMSPRDTFFGKFRAFLRDFSYGTSHLVRFLEEGIAESYATSSLSQGFSYPFKKAITGEFSILNGYYANLPATVIEATGGIWGYIELINYFKSIDIEKFCEITLGVDTEIKIVEK